MDESVSNFIVGTCRILPKSNIDVFQSINIRSFYSRPFYNVFCGSAAEFFIQPLQPVINDVDVLYVGPHQLVFTEDIPVLPNDVRYIIDRVWCFSIEPYHKYPSFVQLQSMGTMIYDWEHKNFVFVKTQVRETLKTNRSSDIHDERFELVGPALKHRWKKPPPISTPVDIVQSVWCPQWPNEANNWPYRERKYGWPTSENIQKIVQNGCHVVFAKHPDCKNDIHQCRLSFSVAEVILLQSWTATQQIVYHLLRFLAKRELMNEYCPKEDEVLCTYHFKTLMLWTCEETSPDWWHSASVVKISCCLLQKLTMWLKDKTCPNYFIPKANLFRKNFNSNLCDEITKRLIRFCDCDNLSLWFLKYYMQPICFIMCNEKRACADSRINNELLFQTCKVMEATKHGHMDWYFSRRFSYSVFSAHTSTKGQHGSEQPDDAKHLFRINSDSPVKTGPILQPSTEIESCFKFCELMLLILHADFMIHSMEMQYENEWFIDVVRQVTYRPKFIRCKHNNFPRRWVARPRKCRLYFLVAQDLMDNLNGHSGEPEYRLVSQVSESLLMKALECDDSETNSIASAALVYMAALQFGASKYRLAIEICLLVIRKHSIQKGKKENVIASCLLFIDGIASLIGMLLLYRHVKRGLHRSMGLYILDLRLTSDIFAHYLIILSNERRSRPLVASYDLQTPNFPFDEIVVTLLNRKSSGMLRKTDSVSRLYERTNPIHELAADIKMSFQKDDQLTFVLRECALENISSFYNAISNDFGIRCNIIIDCYRAAYLYGRRKYREVLILCERILNEPDLQKGLQELSFANVMVVPPLSSFFDTDVQCLLGLHTLAYYLLSLHAISDKTEHMRSSDFQQAFGAKIGQLKNDLSVMLLYGQSVRCNYFLGRHFLARYLKIRCCIDCYFSCSEILFEFMKLRSRLAFEHVIRCFLEHKLRNFLHELLL